MTRPKFVRRLDSDHPPFSLIDLDGSLNARGRAALQTYRDARPVSRRALRRLHSAALRLDAEITRDRLQSDMELAEDLAGWPRYV